MEDTNMEIFMLSDGTRLSYDRGARILDLERENEYLRRNQKKPDDDNDWFSMFLKLAVVVAIIIGIFKFATF